MKLRRMLSPVARLAYLRHKIVLEAALDDLRPVEPALRVIFRTGSEADLRAFSLKAHGYDEEARCFGLERLAAGDRLVIGSAPSGVAFYAWIMFGQMDLGCRAYRPIPRDVAYTYKLFTVPGYRGQRICPAYYTWLKAVLPPEGIRRVRAWVESGNDASMRSHLHSGFHPAGAIWHAQFLFRSYFFVSGREIGKVPAGWRSSSVKCSF
jgi:RimJ/RimL family protein N-acetyltransferase